MVKEIIDKENSKRNSKNITWTVSSKLKNTLKANSPEEEYLANCKLEIEETEKRLKEKRDEFEEAREALPDYKEKSLENFSVRKLSEILTADELNIITKVKETTDNADKEDLWMNKNTPWWRKNYYSKLSSKEKFSIIRIRR